jgi:AcrR family transcriptional regulator
MRSDSLPSGRHGLGSEYVLGHQRARLLEATAHVCATRGYVAMTVADIVGAAGVSRRVFYSQFANKEDCVLGCAEQLLDELGTRVEIAFKTPKAPWPERVAAALSELLDALAANPEMTQVLFVELRSATPGVLVCRDHALAECRRVLAAPRTGLPPELDEAVVGGAVEVIYRAVVAERIDELPRLHGELLYGITMPYLGHEAATELRTRLSA